MVVHLRRVVNYSHLIFLLVLFGVLALAIFTKSLTSTTAGVWFANITIGGLVVYILIALSTCLGHRLRYSRRSQTVLLKSKSVASSLPAKVRRHEDGSPREKPVARPKAKYLGRKQRRRGTPGAFGGSRARSETWKAEEVVSNAFNR